MVRVCSTPQRPPPRSADLERSTLLRAHQPLVRRIARRIAGQLPAHIELDDLMQAGLIGLNDAINRFDQGHGVPFDSYAARRIQGAMFDSLRSSDELGRTLRNRLRQARRAVQRLEHRLGRAPRAKEVANELGWTLQDFHDCMVDAGLGGARTGDEALEHAEDEAALYAAAADPDPGDEHADPARQLQLRQRHVALNAAFDLLEAREQRVMRMLYDFDATQQAVGAELGVSASRVSQIHEEIVDKLRRRLRDW
jgi:RNA polymerase sigma factor for flagellar operon FliA